MANITTNTLKIGDNNLVLRDADAQAKIATLEADTNTLKEDYTSIIDSVYVTDTASGAIASFLDGADNVPVKSLKVNIEPVQSGSGDPSPDNVRPISGHTSAVVTRTGKNLFNPNSSDNLWIGAGNTISYPVNTKSVTIPAKAGQALTASMSNPRTNSNLLILVFFDVGGNILSRNLITDNEKVLTATAPANTASVLCSLYTYSEAGDVQLELDSIATAYEPYQGQVVTIDLDGTRYGGTLDVTTGVLTVDRAGNVYDGSSDEEWQMYGQGSARAFSMKINVADMKVTNPNSVAIVTSNELKVLSPGATWGNYDSFISTQARSNILVAGINTITTVADWRAYLASNPLQVVYELAEPLTVQLSKNDITTLLGQNKIYSDAGTVDVEYRADTKLYIEKLTAPTEDDMVADHAISANSFFMIGNTLYRATTAIASGATITVGTNATKLSLSDALNALS